ncbi:Piso0_001354 [Millerozyma farinosa CBS 7064]|uniref:carnosine N-methyltransferase n=1 Tax=Pichia sorbitophila (strain ATCC MYA-4447 / BCRC 22081 / CBS 7064 / NBRC 10061 / NRRL Y-12695) TaxID=559304 RepID=G8YMY2_PICSO|nr:Piso0_001354 [Millerozyma farinosa CBS 7064]
MNHEAVEDDPNIEEYKALTKTLSAFYNFHEWELSEIIKPKRIKLHSLREDELKLIPWFPKYIDDLELCIGINRQFTQGLALAVAKDWGVSSNPSEWYPSNTTDYDKVRSILLQLSREWSDDGTDERKTCFDIILDEVSSMFPDEKARKNVKVLVPGCGLGRLVLEFVKLGFWCQGNEFSYHMLLVSNFILNHSQFAHEHSMFPYLHKVSHVAKRSNQMRPVTVPNETPLCIYDLQKTNPDINYAELMSMTAGSFVDLYGPPGLSFTDTYSNDATASQFRESNASTFDVVTTCFFLDTATNIIDYLRTIHYCLRDGGTWINFGPLLWHFEDDASLHYVTKESKDGSFEKVPSVLKGLELTRDDLIDLIKSVGFEFVKHQSEVQSKYSVDPRSLGNFTFKSEFWVCKKLSTVS